MTAFDSSLLSTPEYGALLPCTLCVLTAGTPAVAQREVSAGPTAAIAVTAIGGEDAARAFAEAFFASPYVAEAADGRTLAVERTQDGWSASLVPADEALPELTVRFTIDRRIQQYENSAYALPPLEGFTVEDDIPLTDARRIDALRNALFPDMENNCCGVYARVGDAVYTVVDQFSFWLGLVMDTETPRLIAYADLRTDAARYPGYMSRGEAATRRTALKAGTPR